MEEESGSRMFSDVAINWVAKDGSVEIFEMNT